MSQIQSKFRILSAIREGNGKIISRGMRVIDTTGSNVGQQRLLDEHMLTILIDNPDLIRGMPVNVQIVTGKFGEEKAVAVAKAVEEALSLSTSE